MKLALALIAVCAVLIGPAVAADDPPVNGLLWQNEGQTLLHVWGTPHEMGFAHGYFLGAGVMELMRVYAFPPPGAQPWLYELARTFVLQTFDFSDQDMMDEAQGIYDGMLAGGIDRYVDVLQRNFDVGDVLTFNGLNDINAAFCATLVAWDTATADSPLGGEIVVAHNTDFADEDWEAPMLIAKHSVVIAYSPTDPTKQRFISIGNAGTIGTPAAFNESGVVGLLNLGLALNRQDDRILDPKPTLAGWGARRAIGAADLDGQPGYDVGEYIDYFENVHLYSSMIEQAAGPRAAHDPPVVALEINNLSRAMRYATDDPTFAPDMLVVLNWEDNLVPERNPISQARYDLANDLVNGLYERHIGVVQAWDFLLNMQAADDVTETMQSILFLPESMRVALAISDAEQFAPEKDPVWYDFEDFFALPGDDDDDDTADDDDNDDDTNGEDGDDDDFSDDDAAEPTPDGSGDDDEDSSNGGCF
jgi:hypothetical protein